MGSDSYWAILAVMSMMGAIVFLIDPDDFGDLE